MYVGWHMIFPEILDSGAESFGWLTLYLVCALSLVGKEEKV